MSAPRPRSPPEHDPVLPPVPFDDFQFFNPGFHAANAPPPPPLPPSNELFSASETTDLFGFLENFDWDFNIDAFPLSDVHQSDPLYHNPLQETAPPGLDQLPPSSNLFASQPDPHHHHHQHFPQLQAHRPHPPPPLQQPQFTQNAEPNPPMRSRSRSASTSSSPSRGTPSASVGPRVKPLLSTPQKRLNHIMSEQKRRNAIRDGYLQLTTLLAPAGAPPGSGMPTRGRPKGSGSRGRGTKGKSGILFRARAYIQWLEEGRDALLEEVTRMEAAAGIR
ncbi:transcription factor [Ganoderma sinense ZZ0214-1]|uniref:Transcription factor n=1 Tax=Ganoderma sinense ZZ0214-1 TaxID=1077348 RepID=A0A2G8SCE8_9APHY|nr:transcription factor [Ganoderma sinense ZZ0214-1]